MLRNLAYSRWRSEGLKHLTKKREMDGIHVFIDDCLLAFFFLQAWEAPS